MRAARRATFCAITRIASQAPFGRLRIGGKKARGEMVEPHAVLEVSDDALDLGVPAMVGFQFQSVIPVSVSDAAVVAVGGAEGRLGAVRGSPLITFATWGRKIGPQ